MANATGRVPFKAAEDHSLPMYVIRKLAASISPFRGWLMGINSSGYATTQTGAVPNLLPGGIVDRDQDGSSTAGDADVKLRSQVVSGISASSVSNDGFTIADTGCVVWGADNQTFGKKTNNSGSNRSMAGLFLGIDADDGTPVVWTGLIAGLVARAVHLTDSKLLASHAIADAAASTTTAERAIPREAVHGRVTSVKFTGAAIAADNTDYVTITISKRDGAGGGATTVATYDSRAANQGAVTAFTPAAFALSSTSTDLDLLETDVLTVTVAKGGSGKSITGAIAINGKVI